MEKFKQKFGFQNIIFICLCVVGIIAIFLPFIKTSASLLGFTSSETVSLWEEPDGIIILIAFLVIGIINIFNVKILNLILSLATCAMIIYDVSQINEFNNISYGDTTTGFGAILLIIMGVGLVIMSIVSFIIKKKTV